MVLIEVRARLCSPPPLPLRLGLLIASVISETEVPSETRTESRVLYAFPLQQ